MDAKMIIEMIGYFGSALVLVSMLMTSVVKLRVINLTGSIIFAGYALAIRSYPTAFMNIALALINVYQLHRIFGEQKTYNLIETDINDGFVKHILEKNEEDIRYWFPEFSVFTERSDIAYLICCDSDPACVFLGRQDGNGGVEVVLDYARPAYRDTSVGRYLHSRLAARGFSSLVFKQNARNHIKYLEKTGYKKTGDDTYVLDLTGNAH